MLALVLAVEDTVVVKLPHPWFSFYLYRGAPIAFGVALLFFGRDRIRALQEFGSTINFSATGWHLASFLSFVLLEFVLGHSGSRLSPLVVRSAIVLWLALIPTLVFFLLLIFLPLRRMWPFARALGPAWGYAAVITGLMVVLRELLRLSWADSSSRVGSLLLEHSFGEASAVLRLLYPAVISIPATHVLGTERFLVIISGVCSGMEGLALVSSFLLVWFVFARHEIRILRALLLVPVALGMMWALNVARIVALIAIGSAGHPDIALNGFHTEAGWISLNLVSLGFLLVAQNLSWLRKRSPTVLYASQQGIQPGPYTYNPVSAYLAPLLAITAASLISQAASRGFEWLYPLRLVTALIALWVFRREYRGIDWRFGALGPVAGVAVAAMWVGAHSLKAFLPNPSDDHLAVALAALPRAQAIVWILLRATTAVIVVPIVEELAFRGFLARRLIGPDIEGVPYSKLTLFSIAGSSAIFGLVHGRMWAPGLVSGVVFALVAKYRNRLGEAVAAHAVANLGIALVVLGSGNYSLW